MKRNKNKKIIICDIDGTLAYSDTEVSDKMLRLIKSLQNKYEFVTIGGGNFIHLYNQFIQKYQKKIDKEIYVYVSSGLECYKITKKSIEKIYSNELTNEEKHRIVRVISNFIKEKNIVPDTYDQIEDRGSMVAFSLLGRKANKLLKKNYDPQRTKRKGFIDNYFKKKLPGFEIKIGGTTTIDFTKKGFTKAFGIKRIKEMFKCKFTEMIYFGDDLQKGGNDSAVKSLIDYIKVRDPEDTYNKLKKYL
jgi:phosphomannomutase